MWLGNHLPVTLSKSGGWIEIIYPPGLHQPETSCKLYLYSETRERKIMATRNMETDIFEAITAHENNDYPRFNFIVTQMINNGANAEQVVRTIPGRTVEQAQWLIDQIKAQNTN